MTYIPLIGTARIINDAVTGAKVLDGTLTNADINAAAAIAYSKLNLAGSVVNADVASGAAIAYSKLALSNSIVSADIVNGTVVAADTTISLAQLAAQTASAGDITASGQKITNLGTPVASTDATTKAYVDGLALGLTDYKESVRIATTANDTLSGLAARDGVTPIAGDRVAVVAQTTTADNGIYVAAAGAWSRSTDADASAEVTAGMYFVAEEGTNNADSTWLLTTNNPITLGTTGLTFVKLPSLNDLVAGAGLTKTGSTIDVGAGTGITVNANDVAVNTAVVATVGVANVFTANQTFAGINFATTTKTANYTVDLNADHTVFVDSTGGAFTITLPASHTAGDTVVVKDSGGAAGTNAVLVDPADADTIDGASTYSIANPYESIELRSNGTNWFIV